jgi:undecaprenyl-diphosphatase
MTIVTAVILGVVQGLTEFLPVSSSGHLVLFQKIFKMEEPALFFDTMVHIGTLTAVFTVLRRDIWNILKKIIQPVTFFLLLATIPAVIFALIFKKPIENAFSSGKFLGFAFLVTSILLVSSEILSRRKGIIKKRQDMNWIDALIIGLLQAVAVIPGVSRSGSTLSGALFRKLERDFAARFSFLLSIPAILGALVLQMKDLGKGAEFSGTPAASAGSGILGGIGILPLIAGTLTAAVVGFFSIRLMLKIVRERSLFGFAAYTAIVGALVLIDQFGTHLVF